MTETTEVVCPFCSLLCDNLTVENKDDNLVVRNGCPRSYNAYKNFNADISAMVAGAESSYDKALIQAARLLKRSKRPLLAGLGTDVTGMRSVLELADKTGAYIDHMHGGSISNYKVLQNKGYMLTTLGEIKNRADLIICAGTDVISYWEKFFEKFVWVDKTLTDLDPSQRDIIYIGEDLKTKAGIRPDGKKPIHLKCATEDTGEVVAALRSILNGKQLTSKNIAGVSIRQINFVAESIKEADFGVLLWSPTSFDSATADLHIENFSEFVREQNADRRFSSMPIASGDGAMSAYSTATWQTGYPLRTRFLKGFPEYQPDKYESQQLLADEEVDLMLWVSSFAASTAPPEFDGPTIVLGDANSQLDYDPDVFIPISTPGVDQRGQMVRADSTVSLNLKSVVDTTLPMLEDVVGNLMQKL